MFCEERREVGFKAGACPCGTSALYLYFGCFMHNFLTKPDLSAAVFSMPAMWQIMLPGEPFSVSLKTEFSINLFIASYK